MPKRVAPLTARHVANIKRGEELVDGQIPGLRARMSSSGRLTWSLNIRDRSGVRRRFDVGQSLGLAQARSRAEEIRRSVRLGGNPTRERREERERAKAAQQGVGSFASVIDAYFATGPGKNHLTKNEQLKRLKSVFSAHLSRPAVEIRPAELQIAADKHPAAVSAARAVTYVRPLMKWAAKRELATTGFAELEKPSEQRQQRVLSRDELKAVLPHLEGEYGRVARFLLLTAARLREATQARWEEFDIQKQHGPSREAGARTPAHVRHGTAALCRR